MKNLGKIIGFVWVFSVAMSVRAQNPTEDPAAKLAEVKMFALGATGLAGTLSEGQLAYQALAADKEALQKFSRLLKKGNPQAQCYALVWFRQTEMYLFDLVAAGYIRDESPVVVGDGCFVTSKKLCDLVLQIGMGSLNKDAPQNY